MLVVARLSSSNKNPQKSMGQANSTKTKRHRGKKQRGSLVMLHLCKQVQNGSGKSSWYKETRTGYTMTDSRLTGLDSTLTRESSPICSAIASPSSTCDNLLWGNSGPRTLNRLETLEFMAGSASEIASVSLSMFGILVHHIAITRTFVGRSISAQEHDMLHMKQKHLKCTQIIVREVV